MERARLLDNENFPAAMAGGTVTAFGLLELSQGVFADHYKYEDRIESLASNNPGLQHLSETAIQQGDSRMAHFAKHELSSNQKEIAELRSNEPAGPGDNFLIPTAEVILILGMATAAAAISTRSRNKSKRREAAATHS